MRKALLAAVVIVLFATPALAHGTGFAHGWLEEGASNTIRAWGSADYDVNHPKVKVTVELQKCTDGWSYCDANISGVWNTIEEDPKTCQDTDTCRNHTVYVNGGGCVDPWYFRSKVKVEAWNSTLGWHAVDRYTSNMASVC
jgi:hypothetical protein